MRYHNRRVAQVHEPASAPAVVQQVICHKRARARRTRKEVNYGFVDGREALFVFSGLR